MCLVPSASSALISSTYLSSHHHQPGGHQHSGILAQFQEGLATTVTRFSEVDHRCCLATRTAVRLYPGRGLCRSSSPSAEHNRGLGRKVRDQVRGKVRAVRATQVQEEVQVVCATRDQKREKDDTFPVMLETGLVPL